MKLIYALPMPWLMPRMSEESVLDATGRSWEAWWRELDAHEPHDDHTSRAKAFSGRNPDVPGWWVQAITVEFEVERGLRAPGQQHDGSYQLSTSKTLPWDAQEAQERFTLLVPGSCQEGARWTWPEIGADVEVRRSDAEMIRFGWTQGHARSTVEVRFQARPDGRCTLGVRHHGLPDDVARLRLRDHWKGVLGDVAAGA